MSRDYRTGVPLPEPCRCINDRAEAARSPLIALEVLPYSAVVAIAVRAARRVQPLLRLWSGISPGHATAIQAAVNFGEQAAAVGRADPAIAAALLQVLSDVADIALGASQVEAEECRADIPEIVYHATLAASFAVDAARETGLAPAMAAEAVHAANCAYVESLPTSRDAGALVAAVQSDAAFLKLYLRQVPDPATRPIRPADLGILWPNGEPDVMARLRLSAVRVFDSGKVKR